MARFLFIISVVLLSCSCNKDVAQQDRALVATPAYEPEFFSCGMSLGDSEIFEVSFFFTEMRGDTLFWEEGCVKFSDKMFLPAISVKNDIK